MSKKSLISWHTKNSDEKMMVFDIIVVLILVMAIYHGIKDGVIVQLSGLAALFIGVYFAFRFGVNMGDWILPGRSYSTVAGFAIVLVGVMVAIMVIGRVVRRILGLVGLGLIDRIGGALISILKTGLILGLLLYCFDSLNRKGSWIEQSELEESKLYHPLLGVATYAFPYIDFVKSKLLQDSDVGNEQEQSPEDQPKQQEIEQEIEQEDSEIHQI